MKGNQVQGSYLNILENSDVEGLTNTELHELAHNHQKFLQTVQALNEEAEIKITNNNPNEALPFLIQAQKILEYGASCGKNIDRSLIISILHNQACAYQKAWKLTKCSNYLQALIYNMTQYLELEQPKMLKKGTLTIPSCSQTFLEKGMKLTKYYLQFAAVNSQIKNHEDAYSSSKKAINLLRVMVKSLNQSFQSDQEVDQRTITQPKQTIQLKGKIVSSASEIIDTFNIKNLEDYVSTSQYLFKIWISTKASNNSQMIQQILKKFSIGNVMQIVPNSSEEKKQNSVENVYFTTNDSIYVEQRKYLAFKSETYLKILEKILLLSIAYFTAATQLRLRTNQKYQLCQQTLRNSPQYKQSQIYHLKSLMLIFTYIPFQMQFISHIVNSYHKNYNGQPGLFKEGRNDIFCKGVPQILKEIDPQMIHLMYQRKEDEKKPMNVFQTKSGTKNQFITPRSSTYKNIFGSMKGSKRNTETVNNKNSESFQNYPTMKDETCKSIASSKRKNQRISSKSSRSKKSFSTTNNMNSINQQSKKKNQFKHKEYVRLQDYYSPKKKREKERENEGKQAIEKVKGYYDVLMPSKKKKLTKKQIEFKSPLKLKKPKKQKKIEQGNNQIQQMFRKKLKSRSKSVLKSLKSSDSFKGNLKNPMICSQRSLNKTPQRSKKELPPSSQYYN